MAGEGTVTIRILGDAKGALKAFAETSSASEGLGGKFQALGGLATAGFAMVGAAAAGAAVELFHIGESFEESFNKLRAKTGATEEQMKGLEQSFKDVFAAGPDSMGQVTDALGLVSVRTKLTGADLDALTETMLKLARVTGTDVASVVDTTTKAFANWGVTGIGPSKLALDGLYETSVKTGISVTDLADAVSGKGGAAFRGFGVDMQSAATILGTLNAAGVDSQPIVMGLTKALIDAQKTGKDAKTELGDLFDTLKNGADGSKAMGEAIKVFGARGFETLADAVKSGKISLEEFTGTVQTVPGEIDRVAQANLTMGDKLSMAWHKVQVAVEPAAMAVVNFANHLADKLPGAIARVQSGFDRLRPTLEKIGNFIAAVFTPVLKFFADHWDQVKVALIAIGVVLGVAAVAIGVLAGVITGVGVAAFVALGAIITLNIQYAQWFWDKTSGLRNFLGEVASFITGVLVTAFGQVVTVVGDVTQKILDFWNWMKPVRDFLADVFTTALGMLESAFGQLRGAVDWLWSSIQRVVDAAKTAIDYVSRIPGLPGSAGSAGGALQNLYNQQQAGAGGSTGGGPTFQRAAGGPLPAGAWSIVGERGPELLHMGSSAGNVVPNSALGGMTVYLDARGSTMTGSQVITALHEHARHNTAPILLKEWFA